MIEEQAILVNDRKCEEVVVGTIMSYEDAFARMSEFLSPECFFDCVCRQVYIAEAALYEKGDPVSIVSVMAQLSESGSRVSFDDLANICDNFTPVKWEYYAMRLRMLYERRKLWELGQRLIAVGTEEAQGVDEIKRAAVDGLSDMFGEVQGISTLSEAIQSLSEIMASNMRHDGVVAGTPTGFSKFDKKGGLRKSDLVIVAGGTSNGKTSLALSMVANGIGQGAKVAFYSMEMTKEQLAARMIAAECNVPANTILYDGNIAEEDVQAVDRAKGNLPGENLFFDDKSTSNFETIATSIRAMKMRNNIDGAVIDYLQILNVNQRSNQSRENIMGDVSRRLKNLAKELNIWIVALSQLSRGAGTPVPTLNRLRDSGQIAEAADIVILVYRAELYDLPYPSPFENMEDFPTDGTALIDVAKGRNIGAFRFFLGFDKKTTRFYELESRQTAAQVRNDLPF